MSTNAHADHPPHPQERRDETPAALLIAAAELVVEQGERAAGHGAPAGRDHVRQLAEGRPEREAGRRQDGGAVQRPAQRLIRMSDRSYSSASMMAEEDPCEAPTVAVATW
jgi:hypothetical protein